MNSLFGFILVFSAVALSQDRAPEVLMEAAQCLSAKGFLPRPKATALTLGYVDDTKSYPGDEVLYVAVYGDSGHSHGWVFSVFLSQNKGRRVFSIQNNAEFVRSYKKGVAFRKQGVDFVRGGDPLGGVWTQEHIARAIQRIGQQPKFEVQAGDLMKPPSLAQCESYADGR